MTFRPTSLIRPLVLALHPYTPGEQPKVKGLIKLNTNENPYPPSPHVLKTVKAAVDGRLRLYPNPAADRLRLKLSRLHACAPENIIVGNGSDELLALAMRAFVEPIVPFQSPTPMDREQGSKVQSPRSRVQTSKSDGGNSNPGSSRKSTVQFFIPSYSLYPVLADIHGAVRNSVMLNPGFDLPGVRELQRAGVWDFQAALTFITTPNAPSGRGYTTAELEKFCRAQTGVVVLDEAYVDFAAENALKLALRHPHVLVARTFSKAYSLCFQRVGYFVGHPDLIAALQKIRDSYNVNGLGQIAAEATLDDLPYYRNNFRRIISVREELSRALAKLGFCVLPSQTNFILARGPLYPAQTWFQKLRDAKILVRWFDQPGVKDYVRITIGTPAEAEALVRAAGRILR